MKFKNPIQVPIASAIQITQGFGVTAATLEPKGPNGEPHYHYGVDIVCGNDHVTYGASLRCPFPTAHVTEYLVELPGSSQTPFLKLAYTDTEGILFEMVLAHVSEMETFKEFVLGDLVAKIGNIGLVWPQPSLKDPYAGAHLHLGLKRNGAWVDPAEYIDFTNPFIGPGPTQEDALPATNWLIQRILDILKPFF